MSKFGFNSGYVEDLYARYLQNPNNVSKSWQDFFADYQPRETALTPTKTPVTETASPPAPGSVQGDGAAPTPPAPALPADVDQKPLRGAAGRIAENMTASLDIPTATSMRPVPVKLMDENRRLMNNYQRSVGGEKVSFTHLIAWAIVQALRQFPNMYSHYRMDGDTAVHVQPAHINLGLAIDVPRKDGRRSLLVPNIKAADQMTFGKFIAHYNDIVRRSRSGGLTLADFEGTGATLTNPGMIGTGMSVPRLMMDQGVIVAVGSIAYPPEYQALPPQDLSRLGLSKVMTITSTYDHRVIQGAESGAFLAYIAELINGEHGFYQSIFADLHIPISPLAISTDSTPHFGQTGATDDLELIRKQAKVMQLIRAYRVRGHLHANLNPLGYEHRPHPELDPATYGLTIWDLDRVWITDGLGGKEKLPLRDILHILWETYTRTIGIEYMHISDPMEKRWIQERVEKVRVDEDLTVEDKRSILKKLNAAEAFERFLHTKYIGHKRFSLEGAETIIPILDRILSDAADQDVQKVVMGMAHRGRLNVLANILGKRYEAIFSEFEGNLDPLSAQGSGDVKYHLGAEGQYTSGQGHELAIQLASNPSHLEAVNPVVEGMARAEQVKLWDDAEDEKVNYDKVLPILIHGDAAFAGQGVVQETLNLSQLKGYTTGGTIHLVINNQIGFTTSPEYARSSLYATDVARMIQAPIFHVNGDDPEAAVHVARLALDYRQVFNRDVVIDMICYRLHGHNEGDEPSYTQPLLYRKIEAHRSVRKHYTETLLRRGDLSPEEAEHLLDDFQARLQDAFTRTKTLADAPPASAPNGAVSSRSSETKTDKATLDQIVRALTELPVDHAVHKKLQRQIERRKKQYFESNQIDWALAEALAFGSLLVEGHSVRLSGEDSGRGTFSHRHSVIVDQEKGTPYIPLNHIAEGQETYHVHDSLLSEYAVLGFEYGYAVADPTALVIWEAQFGDFANGGQILYDQFISAAEEKWGQTCSLVSLLPHGYEGQGPEHSSARLERFLQLCAEDNMRVCTFTTPANFFHALRRQVKSPAHRPLVIMAPKSLLRHPLMVSAPDAFTDAAFQLLIPATADPANVERLIFCSGKMYFDLAQALAKDEAAAERVALARIEQFYPFPEDEIVQELQRYVNAKTVLWVQEEPKNMGAWTFLSPRFADVMDAGRTIAYVGRPESASPAGGSSKVHAQEQDVLIKTALGQDQS